jgi:hypothetical protein
MCKEPASYADSINTKILQISNLLDRGFSVAGV